MKLVVYLRKLACRYGFHFYGKAQKNDNRTAKRCKGCKRTKVRYSHFSY